MWPTAVRMALAASPASSLEIATAEMAFGLHVSDHRLDGGAASQFALDGAEHAALLPGDEDAVRVRRIVAVPSVMWLEFGVARSPAFRE